jgi:uncharacterized membrane protein
MDRDMIPPAITAAGLIALYASVLGAYALYGLVGPTIAFLLLALISLAAVVLSLIHGSLIGALGMAGALVVPLLVRSDTPSVVTLFSYLTFVQLGALAIVRLRRWWWLAWIALSGAGIWLGLGQLADVDTPTDLLVVAGFATFTGLAFAGFLSSSTRTSESEKTGAIPQHALAIILSAAVVAIFFLMLLLVDHGPKDEVLLAICLFCVGSAGLAFRNTELYAIHCAGAATTILTLLLWALPAMPLPDPGAEIGRPSFVLAIPEAATRYFYGCLIGALFYAGAGLSSAWKRQKWSGLWAALGVATPLAALATAFWRINGFENSIGWAGLGVLAAAIYLYATWSLHGKTGEKISDPARAAFAIGVLASLALAFAMALEKAWLTVALSLLLPAMAWVYSRVTLPILRRVAIVAATIVIVRLVFNPFALDYHIPDVLIFNWLTYGYGIPALAFYWAARTYRQIKRDDTVLVLEAGALVFAVVCLTGQIRLFLHDGDLRAFSYLLSEASLNTALWLALAYGLFRWANDGSSPVIVFGARILFFGALSHIGLVHLFAQNPMFTGEEMGNLAVLNVLFLAYALPIAFLGAYFLPWHEDRIEPVFGMNLRPLLAFVCFSLGLIYLSFEVRRGFQGSVLTGGTMSDAEFYTYSLVWIAYAAVLITVGIWRENKQLRLASLYAMTIATVKIFLFDMSNLEGILRAVSFLGLGASLVTIGFLYQRFVIADKKEPDTEAPDPQA